MEPRPEIDAETLESAIIAALLEHLERLQSERSGASTSARRATRGRAEWRQPTSTGEEEAC
jgi:hypothetical protein